MLSRKAELIVRYADTPTGDWLIDYHPDYENLFIASGDSGMSSQSLLMHMPASALKCKGHGFKFTPNIGREILHIIQRKGDPEYTRRWAFGGCPNKDADERYGVRQVLKAEELAGPEDMKA